MPSLGRAVFGPRRLGPEFKGAWIGYLFKDPAFEMLAFGRQGCAAAFEPVAKDHRFDMAESHIGAEPFRAERSRTGLAFGRAGGLEGVVGCEMRARRRHAVEMRGLDLVPGETVAVGALLVGGDENDVWTIGHGIEPLANSVLGCSVKMHHFPNDYTRRAHSCHVKSILDGGTELIRCRCHQNTEAHQISQTLHQWERHGGTGRHHGRQSEESPRHGLQVTTGLLANRVRQGMMNLKKPTSGRPRQAGRHHGGRSLEQRCRRR